MVRRKEKSGLGLRALSLLHFQDEVLVSNGGAAGKVDVLAAIRQAADGDFMRNALDRREFEAGIKVDGQRDVMPRACFGVTHRRRDS